jgi:hypothetical protein
MRRDLISILSFLIAGAIGYFAPAIFEARSTAVAVLGVFLILAFFAAMGLWENRSRQGTWWTGRVSGRLLLLVLCLVIFSLATIAIPRSGSNTGWMLVLWAVAVAVVLYRILKWRAAGVLKADLKTCIQIGAIVVWLLVLVVGTFVPIRYAMLMGAAAFAALILALFLNRSAD